VPGVAAEQVAVLVAEVGDDRVAEVLSSVSSMSNTTAGLPLP
jgi:hypothetical protein